LRTEDNTALFAAFSRCKEVIPVFIFDESILAEFTRPDARIGFLGEVVSDLQHQLRSH
jgi:deoxyribodipyrimidine photo-lyase